MAVIPRVLLIRHSVTDINLTDEIRSWHDVPLNAEGIRAAEATRDLLAREPIYQIISSDLMRALQTAEIIACNRGLRVQASRDLRTWDQGILIQESFKDVESQLLYYKSHPSVVVPNGESFGGYLTRWAKALRRTLEWAEKNPTKQAALVTHEQNFLSVPWILTGKGDIPLQGGITPGFTKVLQKPSNTWEYKDYGV